MLRILLSCLVVCALQLSAAARTWTDVRGSKVEGDLVAFSSGRVTVRSQEGRMTQLSWSQLSASDQAFVAFAAEEPAPRDARPTTAHELPLGPRSLLTNGTYTVTRNLTIEEIPGLTAGHTITRSLPRPTLQPAPQPGQAGPAPATIEESAACCYPKYIYCGHKGTFHIVGDAGMATYTIGCDQWLARLVPMKPNHPHHDLYFRPVCDDPLTEGWAFGAIPNCHGHYAVYRLVRGRWCLFDSATRAVPN
jgi:hypothetical protein